MLDRQAWPVPFQESERWHKRACRVEPGGVQGEGRYYEPFPLFVKRADGSRIWDVDGNEYLDYHGSFGAAVLGHNHPAVKQAVMSVLEHDGPLFAAPHPGEVQLAERVVDMVPCAEKVAFVCSGTDATYHCLRLTRATTGREKILKFEGHYHGWHDFITWSTRFDPELAGDPAHPEPVPCSAGLLNAIADTVVVREWNDFAGLENAFEENGDELAAVILEPILHSCGIVEPTDGFLERCRELCDEHGALLVFDEVLTGFRHAPGGAQELFGVVPDLTAMGKAVANGFPLSLVAGRDELMSNLSPEGPTFFSGTFNGQLLNVAAAHATTGVLLSEPVHRRLQRLGSKLREGIQAEIDRLRLKVQIVQHGSVWCIYFTDRPVRTYRDIAAFTKDKNNPIQRAYQRWMLERGVYIQPTYALRAFISGAHTEKDIDRTVHATGEFLRAHRQELI